MLTVRAITDMLDDKSLGLIMINWVVIVDRVNCSCEVANDANEWRVVQRFRGR